MLARSRKHGDIKPQHKRKRSKEMQAIWAVVKKVWWLLVVLGIACLLFLATTLKLANDNRNAAKALENTQAQLQEAQSSLENRPVVTTTQRITVTVPVTSTERITVTVPITTAAPAPVVTAPITTTAATTGTLTFGGQDRPANCPTDGAMQSLFGFDQLGIKPVFTGEGVPWDHCKWTLQAIGIGKFNLPLLKDWEFTVTRAADDVVAVYNGDGTTLSVKGASIRYIPAYNTEATMWLRNGCELLDREDSFGHRRVPVYHTVSGNVACPTFAHPLK
jgi:hypothetical protein